MYNYVKEPCLPGCCQPSGCPMKALQKREFCTPKMDFNKKRKFNPTPKKIAQIREGTNPARL